MLTTSSLISSTGDAATIVGIALLCVLALGCERTPVGPDSSAILPQIRGIRITESPGIGLGALATISASSGVVATVEVMSDSRLIWSTRAPRMERDSITLPLLGLHASSHYDVKAAVISSTGDASESSSLAYATEALPASMPQFTVLNSNSPTVRYVMLGITPARSGKSCAVIIDTAGRAVWYKEFLDAVVDFQKQPDGCFTAWSSTDGSPSHYYRFNNLGQISNEFRASGGLDTDPHELRMRGGSYALFAVEPRTMDLSSLGGLAASSVQGYVVEYHRPGMPPLLWSTFDHFALTDAAVDIPLNTQRPDPWHGNAIEIESDGNLLVSFRNSDEITKINAATGNITWRWGGKKNQFVFRNDELNGFSHQHGVRRLDNGNIILFDDGNLHSPPTSRAVEYRLDEAAKIATLVWEYRPNPPIAASALGFAQRLPNGNTLICFGTAQRIIEVDPSGSKLWDVALSDPQRYAYRAIAIESLY